MNTRLSLLLLLFPTCVWGAFPTIESSNSGSATGDTTPTLTMPATVSADAVIVACQATEGGSVLTWNTATYGTWTELVNNSTASQIRFACYAILADGDEDSGTFDNTMATGVDTVWFIYSIIGWENDTVVNGIECGTSASGTSANPDPPSVTPSWGDTDNLYLAMFGKDVATSGISVYPYADNQIEVNSGGSFTVSAGSSTDELTGTSQNPGAYTVGDSDNWWADTCVIQPAAASNTPLRRRR